LNSLHSSWLTNLLLPNQGLYGRRELLTLPPPPLLQRLTCRRRLLLLLLLLLQLLRECR
jgi:hypothetical protein